MGSTRHLSGRDPAIAMLQVEGFLANHNPGEYFRGACMSLRAAPSRLTGLGGQSRNALQTKGTAGPPAIIREHTDARASACRLKQVFVSSIVESPPVWWIRLATWIEGSASWVWWWLWTMVCFELRQLHNNTVRSTPLRIGRSITLDKVRWVVFYMHAW